MADGDWVRGLRFKKKYDGVFIGKVVRKKEAALHGRLLQGYTLKKKQRNREVIGCVGW